MLRFVIFFSWMRPRNFFALLIGPHVSVVAAGPERRYHTSSLFARLHLVNVFPSLNLRIIPLPRAGIKTFFFTKMDHLVS